MINHLSDYDNINSLNARVVALKAQKQAIEEELWRIMVDNHVCPCGYIITHAIYERDKQTKPTDSGNTVEFYQCPCCGRSIYGP